MVKPKQLKQIQSPPLLEPDEIKSLLDSTKRRIWRRHLFSTLLFVTLLASILASMAYLFQNHLLRHSLKNWQASMEQLSAHQVEIQLKRKPKKLPRIKINPDIDDVFNFTFDDFELIDYNPHPAIKAVVSI